MHYNARIFNTKLKLINIERYSKGTLRKSESSLEDV